MLTSQRRVINTQKINKNILLVNFLSFFNIDIGIISLETPCRFRTLVIIDDTYYVISHVET